MRIKWKALVDPHATTAEFLGIDYFQHRLQDKLDAEKRAKGYKALGLRLTDTQLIRIGGRGKRDEVIPLKTIQEVAVTAEPTTLTGAIGLGPVGFVGQRAGTFLTLISTGPVWSLPIRRKDIATARELAARILTMANAARTS